MEKLKSKEINAKWRNGQVSAMSTMLMASGMGSMHRYNQTQWWYIDPVGHFRMGWNIVLVCLFSTVHVTHATIVDFAGLWSC